MATNTKATDREALPARLSEQNIMVGMGGGTAIYRAVTGIRPPRPEGTPAAKPDKVRTLWGGKANPPKAEPAPEPDDEEGDEAGTDDDPLFGATGWVSLGRHRVPVTAGYYGDVLVWYTDDEHPAWPRCPQGHTLEVVVYDDQAAEWRLCQACKSR